MAELPDHHLRVTARATMPRAHSASVLGSGTVEEEATVAIVESENPYRLKKGDPFSG